MDWGYIFSVMISSAFGVEAIVFGLAAIGINMQFGYTGLLNFGQSAFMAIGGYSIAVTVVQLGVSFWWGIVIGFIASVLLALLLGVPTLRLRADYLAIVTIAASEIVRLLVRSPWGRVLKGIREDEDAVRSLGKNVYLYKMQALIIGGMIGTVAGFVFAVGNEAVSPDFFGTDTTFFAYAILILGGAARVFGPVLGTVIFWAIIQGTDVFLRSGIDAGLPVISLMSGSQAAVIRFILVGLMIMLLMIFRPQGILGDRKELALDAR